MSAAARAPLACSSAKPTHAREYGPGVIVSALVHGLALGLILLMFGKATQGVQVLPRILPVDIVPLGDDTTSPLATNRALVPAQSAARHLPSRAEAESETPRTRAVPDPFETRLKALSKLRQPDSALAVIDNGGIANADASNGGTPGAASYSVKDYIRAQVLRRWSVDFGWTGGRSFTVLIRVAIKGNGVVTETEILNTQRAATDKAYRDVAISARNAVLLSSPFTLPAGQFARGLELTLDLNPRDTLR